MSISDTPIFDQMDAWLKETKGVTYKELLESMKPKPSPRLCLSKKTTIKGQTLNGVYVDEVEEEESKLPMPQEEVVRCLATNSQDETIRMAAVEMIEEEEPDLLFVPRPYMTRLNK